MAYRAPPASRFRDRIIIERQVGEPDGMGGTNDVWTPLGEDYLAAAILEAKGGERVQSDRLSSIAAVDIWVRNHGDFDLLTTDRIRNIRTDELYGVKWVGNLDQDPFNILIVATRGEVSNG